jgi:hypothetical protein
MYMQIAALSSIVFFLVELVKKIMPDKLEAEYIPIVAAGIGIGLAVFVGIKAHLDIISCIIQGAQLGGNAILAASGRSFVGVVADKVKNGKDSAVDGKKDGHIAD